MTHIAILNCTFSVYTYTIFFSFLGKTCIVNWSTAYIIRIYNNPVFVPVIDDDQSGRPTMLDSDAAFISDFLPKELKSFVVPPSFHPKTINGSLEMSYERKQSWDITGVKWNTFTYDSRFCESGAVSKERGQKPMQYQSGDSFDNTFISSQYKNYSFLIHKIITEILLNYMTYL